MNLSHLKYVVEVEKCKSISKAANNLHMGQPNLSRGIKELEDNIGIKIFNRSSKGITVTESGEEFIFYAKAILEQVDYVESFYQKDKEGGQNFSISVERADYIFRAFSDFSKSFDISKELKLQYKESNAKTTIDDVIKGDFNLGIIRYSQRYANYFDVYLKEKGLSSNEILDFTSFIIFSEDSLLANKNVLTRENLKDKIEIDFGDLFIPNMHITEIKRKTVNYNPNENIKVFDRASAFQLLEANKDTYFSSSPLDEEILRKYHLVQKQIEEEDEVYKDILIFRSTYHFRDIDKNFLNCLMDKAREIAKKVDK